MEELIKKVEEDFKDAQIEWIRAKTFQNKESLGFTCGKINVLTNILMYLYKINK